MADEDLAPAGPSSSAALASGSAKLPVQVRTLDGKTVKIQAYTNWTVLKLKEEFGKWRGQGYDKINLFYRAIKLDDKEFLSKYNIEPGTVSNLQIHSRIN